MGERVKSNRVENRRTVDDFVREIGEAWRQQAEGVIKAGRLLIEAQEALGHGQWGEMFKNAGGPLPFSDRTAQRLMKIAEHPLLSNPTHVSLLPPSWGTLHALAQLPTEALEEMMADGTLNCEITRKEVDEIHLKARQEGTYVWLDLRHALNQLIKFRKRWPQPDQIVEHVVDQHEEERLEFVDEPQLEPLSAWIANLATACDGLWEKVAQEQEKEEREREAQERAEAEARTERVTALGTEEAVKRRKATRTELHHDAKHNVEMRKRNRKYFTGFRDDVED